MPATIGTGSTSGNPSVTCRYGAIAPEQPFQQSWVGRPRGQQRLPRDAPGGVPQQQDHRDHVVQRADDRQELRQQVDRRDDPHDGDEQGHLRPARDVRMLAQRPRRVDAGGEELGHLPRQPGRQARGHQHHHHDADDPQGEQGARQEKDALHVDDRSASGHGAWTGSVTGFGGPTPPVIWTVKVTSAAPSGTGPGSGSVWVDSSASSKGIVPSFASPALTAMVPAQPLSPLPHVSCRLASPWASGVMVVLATLSSDGKTTPVGVLSPFGSKQPSNSKTGLVTSWPLASVMVRKPVSLLGPPTV